MRAARTVAVTAVLLCAAIALAASFQPPPTPTHYVTDQVGFLSPSTRAELDARLERYNRDTGHQVIVWIGSSTGDVPLEEWAARTFEAWGVGRRGKDDGAALFVFANDRRLRIEVGYGLEGDVPDAIANRIIQEEAVPRLRAGDRDGAIVASVDALLQRIGGERNPPPKRAPAAGSSGYGTHARPLTPGQLVLFGLVGLALLIIFITHPRLAFWLLFSILSGGGGRRRGGWGSGGGFGGGGGRSGGGGASGSW